MPLARRWDSFRRFLGHSATLERDEWVALFQSARSLVEAWVLVRTRPRGQLVTFVDALDPGPEGAPLSPTVEKLALSLERAAEYGPLRPSCLVRAVALKRLLDRRGFSGSAVKIGVRMAADGFSAHAWVEYRGHVLADRSWHVARYRPLASCEVSRT